MIINRAHEHTQTHLKSDVSVYTNLLRMNKLNLIYNGKKYRWIALKLGFFFVKWMGGREQRIGPIKNAKHTHTYASALAKYMTEDGLLNVKKRQKMEH